MSGPTGRPAGAVPAWWRALEGQGLSPLSPPELERALAEFVLERRTFLRMLSTAARWPDDSVLGWRVPDDAEMERLDRALPRSRAVVSPRDLPAVEMAAATFEVVLAFDPFWPVRDALYAAWHDPGGLSPKHARALLEMAAPAVRLAPLVERGVVRFIPDWVPGSWEPFPMAVQAPADSRPEVQQAYALRRAAALLHWGDRLRAVCLTTRPPVAATLRDLASAGADLHRPATETFVDLPRPAVEPAALLRGRATGDRRRWRTWAAACTRELRHAEPRPAWLAARLGAPAGRGRWVLGIGAPALPDVSLALRRAFEGRGVRDGLAGRSIALRRPPVYLVRRGR